MNNVKLVFVYFFVSMSVALSSGCATKQVDLYDSLAIKSTPNGANIYIKRLDAEFSKFEVESNNSGELNQSYFAGVNEAEDSVKEEDENVSDNLQENILVLTGKTPARFSLHRKGEYAVVIEKNGFVTQTAIVQDKLTAGEAAGNVAKTAGVGVAASALTFVVPIVGLAVLAGSAAKKGANAKSGKNKELSPNPLIVTLEATENVSLEAAD